MIPQRDTGAGFCQTAGDLVSDAASAAGDDDYLAMHGEHLEDTLWQRRAWTSNTLLGTHDEMEFLLEISSPRFGPSFRSYLYRELEDLGLPAHADRLFYPTAVLTATFGVDQSCCKSTLLPGLVTPPRTGDSAPTDEVIRGRRRSKP